MTFFPCALCGSWPESCEGWRSRLGMPGIESRYRVFCRGCNRSSDDFDTPEDARTSWNAKQAEMKKLMIRRWQEEEAAYGDPAPAEIRTPAE